MRYDTYTDEYDDSTTPDNFSPTATEYEVSTVRMFLLCLFLGLLTIGVIAPFTAGRALWSDIVFGVGLVGSVVMLWKVKGI